jgi:PIN domain nuclease of toxin-antitoxin system
MKIILDTHIFLWALSDPTKIDSKRLIEIETKANSVFVSSISIAEIMIKASLGKLKIDFNPSDIIQRSGFDELSFSVHDAALLKDLPYHHKDPFDRMLIAQAINNSYSLMSDDQKFEQYDCKLI